MTVTAQELAQIREEFARSVCSHFRTFDGVGYTLCRNCGHSKDDHERIHTLAWSLSKSDEEQE